MKPIIQLQNVSKSFRAGQRYFNALEQVNLTINEGEFVAIVGSSGSGKSTLLNMFTGIDHPTKGTVTINDADIHALNESKLARWRGENVGIVFQFFQLIPTLSIADNLFLAMDFVKVIPKKDRKQRMELLLEQVGIADHADKLPSALSGGEQQRAAIARALVNDPPILVADEPTGNLDSKTARAIWNLFYDFSASGKTILIVTHEKLDGLKFDRVVSLKDGKIHSTHTHLTVDVHKKEPV